jgi:membrane-bound lytic murein transglycosylase D
MQNRLTWLMAGGLVAALSAGLAGCDQSSKRQVKSRPPEMAPQPPPPPVGQVPVDTRRAQSKPLTPPPPEAVEVLLERVEAAFQAGEASYKAGHLEKARREFDRAVDWVLLSGIDLDKHPRLAELFNRVVETVHSYEAAAFREGSGLAEPASEPAAIDEIAEMEFPLDPRLRERVEENVRAVPHDLPITVNDHVLQYVNFFQTPRGRGIVERGLARAGRYREMIQRVLAEEGLPQDLIYLAQAESAFKPTAVSRARARGIWQFMSWRGQEYGLKVSWWVDERQDPEKSTRAAARHLKDLYKEFGDWHLALAAYNSGPGNVSRGILRTGYADFWELYKRNVLPRETKNYVPIILALTIIAKDPQRYGIEVRPEAPYETDTVKPGNPIDLRLVAETIDVDVDTLKTLNPHLLRSVTPNDPEFELHLPAGTAERFFAEVAAVPKEKWTQWRRHRVESGETLSGLAKQYRVAAAAIAEVNGLDAKTTLQVGEKLIIPATAPSNQGKLVRYRVRRGDTLSSVARQFDVTVEELQRWNGIRGTQVRRGAVLKVYPGGRPPAKPARGGQTEVAQAASAEPVRGADSTVEHRVKPGETLWSIARAYRTTVEALRATNQFLLSRPLRAGDLLVILSAP